MGGVEGTALSDSGTYCEGAGGAGISIRYIFNTPRFTALLPTPSTSYPAHRFLASPFSLVLDEATSHGYVTASSIMEMWKSRFEFLYNEYDEEERKEGGKGEFLFPLVLHPDTSGMAHVIGMIDKMIGWLKSRGEEVQFCKFEDVAREWKAAQKI